LGDAQTVQVMKSLGLVIETDESEDCQETVVIPELPEYNPDTDYYKEYFKTYLQNENLVADIDQIANENFKMDRKILAMKDFYDNTLIP
jgi:hypothetical protein